MVGSATVARADVSAFVMECEDAEYLRALNEMVVGRLRDLRDVQAAKVRTEIKRGTNVETTEDVRPKYMSGLRGQIASITGKRVLVLLPPDEVQRIRWARGERYLQSVGNGSFGISVPLVCVRPGGTRRWQVQR